ncbi:GPR1/FUN34/YaaH family transporter [Kitasatospora brasiliensis]|uniref:GPR1/FUN34/YaaH family transporter n=1 Tax=Kitasatospora brasiliensis TaxID=3058040 RepID=UPI002930A2BC|nr:GPR1/FUN34/YaaH family transporter [Kitasatospora sp. K002]
MAAATEDQHVREPGGTMTDTEPEPYLHAMTRVNLRPIATPMPLGFFTVAISSTVASSLQLGLIDHAHRQAVALTLFSAFVLQLLVSILAFGARDVIAATLMGGFAGAWLANGLVTATNSPGGAQVLGVMNLVFTVFAALMASVARPKKVLWILLMIAVPRYFVAGLYGVTDITWLGYAAGALGMLLAAVAMYVAYALMLEELRGKEALWIGRSGPVLDAMHSGLAGQLHRLEQQAGVRRTL